MARSYANTTDKHRFTLVEQMTGAFSIGAWVKRASDTTFDCIYSRVTSGGQAKVALEIGETDHVILEETGLGEKESTLTVLSTDGWVFIGVDKAAGTTTPRCHVWKQASGWTHQNLSGTLGNPVTAGTSATIRIGEWQGGSTDNFNGEIEIVFEVNGVQLTDAEWESAAFSRDGIMAQAPTALWELRQSATTEKVRDLTGNGNNESEVSGTTVGTRSCPFYFAGGPAVYSRQPAEGGTTPAAIPLNAAAGTSFTSLSVFAPTQVPLNSAAGIAATSLALTAPTQIPIAAASGASSTSLALRAPTQVPLSEAAAAASTALALAAPTQIPLSAASGVASTALALSAPTRILLSAAEGIATTSLALQAPTQIPLAAAAGSSSTSLALRAPTQLPLSPAPGNASASMALTAPTRVQLSPATGTSSTSLILTTGIADLPLAQRPTTLEISDPSGSLSLSSPNFTLIIRDPSATAELGDAAAVLELGEANATLEASDPDASLALDDHETELELNGS